MYGSYTVDFDSYEYPMYGKFAYKRLVILQMDSLKSICVARMLLTLLQVLQKWLVFQIATNYWESSPNTDFFQTHYRQLTVEMEMLTYFVTAFDAKKIYIQILYRW